jgi:hypothetical protein
MTVDDEEFKRLKRENLALLGIPSELADSLDVADVRRNENGSVTVSYVAQGAVIPWADFQMDKK